jgi:hypothetical protein
MLVDTRDDSTKLTSERKVFVNMTLQIQTGWCPRAVSTDGWPPWTFIASC